LPMFFLSGAMFPLQGLPGWMTVLTKINPLSYGVDMLRGIALKGVSITGSTPSIFSKIPKAVVAQIPPQAKAAIANAVPKVQLQTQRYPLWLDLLIVIGFSIVMLGIAIGQFNRQEGQFSKQE